MKRDKSLYPSITRSFLIVPVILAFLLFGPSLSSQTNMGRIMGAVHDPAGVALRSSAVTISDSQHGATRVLVTGRTGDYVAPNLPPGLYSIRAEADGYKTLERSIQLEVGQDVRIDFVLQPGEVSAK